MNKPFLIRTFLAAAAALAILGCSSSANPGAPKQDPVTGAHPATWLAQDHWQEYLKNPSACTPCHGSTTDAAAAGGTSQVSCFGCHHPSGPNHPAGWADPMHHGRLGAQAAADASAFSMKGMQSCQPCHGADYRSALGVTPSCYSCHTRAPHPDAPWGATNPPADGTTAPSHDRTDPSNAPACFQCHAAGSPNNAINPVTPAPAGTTPGCFNGTMCHTKSF